MINNIFIKKKFKMNIIKIKFKKIIIIKNMCKYCYNKQMKIIILLNYFNNNYRNKYKLYQIKVKKQLFRINNVKL